jgi:hypothetical protein
MSGDLDAEMQVRNSIAKNYPFSLWTFQLFWVVVFKKLVFGSRIL